MRRSKKNIIVGEQKIFTEFEKQYILLIIFYTNSVRLLTIQLS